MFKFWVACALMLGAAEASMAQVTWEQPYRGHTVGCGVSGLRGFGDFCGFENYEAAFTGKIVSVKELPGDEFELVVSPAEVFKGELKGLVTVTTRSGACMTEFREGDDWLFSLRGSQTSKGVYFWFGAAGGPVKEREELIARFRRLKKMNDSGLIKGEVREEGDSGAGRVGQKVIVRGVEDGVEHVAMTDALGAFAFPALPAGKYFLNPNTVKGLWSGDGGETTVEAHGCRDYHIEMHVDGSVAGTVVLPGGDTSRTWQVSASPVDEPELSSGSASTTEGGQFTIRGLKAGRYVIGIVVVGVSSPYELRYSIYAPGVRDRVEARVVTLGTGETVSGVEFVVPAGAVKAKPE